MGRPISDGPGGRGGIISALICKQRNVRTLYVQVRAGRPLVLTVNPWLDDLIIKAMRDFNRVELVKYPAGRTASIINSLVLISLRTAWHANSPLKKRRVDVYEPM